MRDPKQEMRDRLMRMLDGVSDVLASGSSERSWHLDETEDRDRALELDYLRAIAAGVGAIAFLLLEQNEDALREWWRY